MQKRAIPAFQGENISDLVGECGFSLWRDVVLVYGTEHFWYILEFS